MMRIRSLRTRLGLFWLLIVATAFRLGSSCSRSTVRAQAFRWTMPSAQRHRPAVYEKAKEPRELFLISGASHIDLYYKLRYVPQVVAKLKDFYSKHL